MHTEMDGSSAGLVLYGVVLQQKPHQAVPVSTSVITERFYTKIVLL